MKKSILLSGVAAFAVTIAALAAPPAPPPVKPVTETLWGQQVTDNYRFMEAMGPETVDWMKSQGAYTRSVMDSIAPRAALEKSVSAFTGSFGFIQGYVTYGGRAFYEERTPGSDNFDLIVSDAKGKRKIVDVAKLRAEHGDKPYAINYFLASPDGTKVAVGVSEGGSEAAILNVYDAVTGAKIAGPVDRADFGTTAWTDNGKLLYLVRLKKMAPNDPPTDKYKFATAQVWDLKSEPVNVAGSGVGQGTSFTPDEFPVVSLTPASKTAVLYSINGVQNELKLWTTSAAEAAKPDAPWKLLVDREDGVTGIDVHGNEIFLLSHKDAPTFKVLALKAGAPLSSAKVLVPAAPARVIESIHAAADALYVLAREGAYSQLLRIPYGTTKAEEIALPARGHVTEVFSDPRRPGLTIDFSSWVVPPTEYAYVPKKGFTKLNLGTPGDIDPKAFTVSDLEAKSHDGVMVPLSLIREKGAAHPQIVVIEAYGSYGISELADFSSRRAAVMKQGIAYGVCHVRGGGELGEAWRLGGKDANKHNTWEDIIACGEDLIARGITTKDKLFILGGSAGGITMGRAMTDRPDLFAGVIDVVPAANTLRAEFTPNGPPNIPEFGTVTKEDGFKNLYMMDSIQHVKAGVTYPAIMISTGLNDPRVSPWEPAKFAAALEASGTSNPVLLRIDEQAGHGIGSTKTQTDKLTTDWIAFMKWRAGEAAWQPTVK